MTLIAHIYGKHFNTTNSDASISKTRNFSNFLVRFRNLREIWIFSKNKMTVIAHIFWKFRTPKYVAR